MSRGIIVLATALLALAAGLAGWRFIEAPTVLRIAVGPAGSEDVRLITAAAQYLAREHEDIRLKLVPTADVVASAAALDEDEADLAIVRSDAAMPQKGQTVAILHRDVAILVSVPSRGLASMAQLRGRRLGVLRRFTANGRLLDALLGQYEVPTGSVTLVPLDDPSEVEGAFRSGAIDAMLAVGTLSGRAVSDTIAGVAAAADAAAPVFIAVSEAEAIAQRSPLFTSTDVVRGAFGGSPPRPADPFKTLAVSHRIVVASAVGDSTVSDLTRLLFVMRPTLAATVPLADRIEGPDTSKSSSLPLHPGASAFYDGEVETFFERYSDWIYIGAMFASVIGSGFAALASRASSRRRSRTLGLLDRLLGIIQLARAADGVPDLDELERETDGILAIALGKTGSGELDGAGISAFTLGLEQCRHAIANRRRALGLDPPVRQGVGDRS